MHVTHHRIVPIALLSLVMSSVAWTAVAAPSVAPVAPQASTAAVEPDFDGDQVADLVVGVGTNVAKVVIRYGSGTTQEIIRADLDQANSYGFGQLLLARDLNGDGYTDLVVGDGDSNFSAPATLWWLFGSANGLQTSGAVALAVPKLPVAGPMALVTSPSPLLVIGGGYAAKGGSLLAIPLGSDGRASGDPFVISQATKGVPGADESGDRFGSALAATGSMLIVGAPGEDVGKARDAGAITALTYKGGTSFTGVGFTQNSKGVPGKAESGDRFGTSVAASSTHVVVGAPGEDGAKRDSGVVQVFKISAGKLKPGTSVTQDSAGIPGKSETGDQFGWSVTMARTCANVPGFAVGAPNEAIGSTGQAGSVWLIGLVKGCTTRQLYAGHGLAGSPVEMARIGSGLSALHTTSGLDTVVIAAEGVSEEGVYAQVFTVASPYGSGTAVISNQIIHEERSLVLSSPKG